MRGEHLVPRAGPVHLEERLRVGRRHLLDRACSRTSSGPSRCRARRCGARHGHLALGVHRLHAGRGDDDRERDRLAHHLGGEVALAPRDRRRAGRSPARRRPRRCPRWSSPRSDPGEQRAVHRRRAVASSHVAGRPRRSRTRDSPPAPPPSFVLPLASLGRRVAPRSGAASPPTATGPRCEPWTGRLPGGGEGTRTLGLYIANVALYQLSYTPAGPATLPQGPARPSCGAGRAPSARLSARRRCGRAPTPRRRSATRARRTAR